MRTKGTEQVGVGIEGEVGWERGRQNKHDY